MGCDGKLLRRAKERLAVRRAENSREQEKRRAAVYARHPEIKELDDELRGTMSALIGAALGGRGSESALEEIRSRNLMLQMRRTEALRAAGYPTDYLDEIYTCKKCKDMGFDGTKMCDCLKELYKDEQNKELSGLLRLGSETFDNFSLDWYDDAPAEGGGVSCRQCMEIVYENCLQYARRFGKSSGNLFLNGGTGLGKTFLSTCIAKVVSENGFSVVYDTAIEIFTKFEEEKFSRNPEEARTDTQRYMNCDLLILDDLGTEMTTSFTVSCLYNIINTRLISGKKTIISSNLKPEELGRRYSPQIMSRLLGEYQVLNFYGSDIRLKKRRAFER